MDFYRVKLDHAEIPHVAVAVRQMQRPLPHTHAGIVHRDESGKLFLLEYCWQNDLRNDPHAGPYICLVPEIPEERAQIIAGLCRLIWECRENRQAFYGFRYLPDEDVFNAITGRLEPSLGFCGFTCSTFPLAVFHSGRFPLLRYANWPPRDEDKKWYEILVGWM